MSLFDMSLLWHHLVSENSSLSPLLIYNIFLQHKDRGEGGEKAALDQIQRNSILQRWGAWKDSANKEAEKEKPEIWEEN